MDQHDSRPISILVVEDDLLNLTLLKGLLHELSLKISRIETAGTLRSTLTLLDNNHYDVVLLDLNLPDSICLDTLRSITKKQADMPVVVITGAYGQDLGPKAISSGAQSYLLKGQYDGQMLSQAIVSSIESKRAKQTPSDVAVAQ